MGHEDEKKGKKERKKKEKKINKHTIKKYWKKNYKWILTKRGDLYSRLINYLIEENSDRKNSSWIRRKKRLN